MPAFTCTIGIDYDGAETPATSLKGLRADLAEACELPVEVPPSTGHSTWRACLANAVHIFSTNFRIAAPRQLLPYRLQAPSPCSQRRSSIC